MYSDLIGKIEKAHRYAEEPDRIRFNSLDVDFRGENDMHHVQLTSAGWSCNCNFFQSRGTCSHVMALQRVLKEMLPPQARFDSMPDRAAAPAS